MGPKQPPRQRRILGIALLLLVAGASAYAVQQSVTVEVRWRVLPYQTLRLVGSGAQLTSATYAIPDPSALDLSRGYIEAENALRLQVVSNTPWKIQVWTESAERLPAGVLVRRQGGTYLPIGSAPQVLASGSHGTFDVAVDYRIPLDGDLDALRRMSLEIVYTLMSD